MSENKHEFFKRPLMIFLYVTGGLAIFVFSIAYILAIYVGNADTILTTSDDISKIESIGYPFRDVVIKEVEKIAVDDLYKIKVKYRCVPWTKPTWNFNDALEDAGIEYVYPFKIR